jgi:hypothetical protein
MWQSPIFGSMLGKSRAQSWQASFTFRFDKTLLSGESWGCCAKGLQKKMLAVFSPNFVLLALNEVLASPQGILHINMDANLASWH